LNFVPGQRWHSLTEPELGLGLVDLVEHRQVVISYPARGVTRRYTVQNAPLARAQLIEGQRARGAAVDFLIEEVVAEGDLFRYRGAGQELSEVDLDASIDVATPENRLRTGQVDAPDLFDLRHGALDIRHRLLSSPARGFLGGRIRLFDHQLSIARDVCERHRVRVLLADEVGLGKTIEALLILHRMLLTGRVENALILVPPALVHQWLAEAYLRFHLILRVIGPDTHGGGTIDPESEDLPEQLLDAQLFICPLGVDVGASFIDTPWDIVIVDEAHHLRPASGEYELVERLASHVRHLILLSATPDRDGEAAHFQRLKLLDPARFHDADAYRDAAPGYQELADTAERLQSGEPLSETHHTTVRQRLVGDDVEALLATATTERQAQQALLRRLLDLHGIGRVMFRNVRARIPGFPRRDPQPVELPTGPLERLRREFLNDIGQQDSFHLTGIELDPRTLWLAEFLDQQPQEKVLVLAASRLKVEAFTAALTASGREVARFHEEMSTIERDQQAAWFLDPEGPQVVISSAIGAEGRNFQVARHLVLLDLPLTADRLEQSIGRVDRIGQGVQVHIHAVVVLGSPQARLRRWLDEALHVFHRPWHGSPVIEREFGQDLLTALLAPEEDLLEALIERGRRRNEQIVAELESGRDRLLELTSFDTDAARELQGAITRAEKDTELETFMVDAFERGGLDVELIGTRSYAVRAGMDYHRPFPGFHGDEIGVTFDRAIGLAHPERSLLTWDHPMVRDTVDGLLDHETGNASLAVLPGAAAPGLLLEALFVAEPTLDLQLRADRFLPPAPIHVVLDAGGEEATLDTDAVQNLQAADPAVLDMPQVQQLLPTLLQRAREIAEAQAPTIGARARRQMRRELEPVVTRLQGLSETNPAVGTVELDAARAELQQLDEGLLAPRVRLDGLRLILLLEE
jgi:ATP-dependent helicase HepA